ncbi:hypothetical protein EJ08DRAFT_591090 [Tothia fuscella]|uniref:Zn(2)-C6 fungal-type domain-containing protein n=1 Tax=Tothia fuscella TaxID=1048955 RepID=A0A9P4TXW4_9PEZI|nr:hypothetical protein EJ08DRAFT_591090 [Tothia fuscella]
MPTASTAFANGDTTTHDRPKLRNSCHACAASKLKCSQEKPACARCVKRRVPCEYVAAKRGGRKPSKSNETGGNDVSNITPGLNGCGLLPPQSGYPEPSSTKTSNIPLLSPRAMHESSGMNTCGSLDMLQDFLGPLDRTMSSTSAGTDADLDDFFMSPLSFSMDMSDMNIFGKADLFPMSMDSGRSGVESLPDSLPESDDGMSDFFTLSLPSSTPHIGVSPQRELDNYHEVHTKDPHCSCLVQALGFMKQLFSSSSDACNILVTQDLEMAAALSSIQAVIAQNEATIEAVSTMLNCGCSQDGYLLAVMSLIIFKVLGCYAAIARKTPVSQCSQRSPRYQSTTSEQALQNATILGNYRLGGADSERMAAQLVLSELHRVRRLVDQLSSKLEVQARKEARGAAAATAEMWDMENEMTLPLSGSIYDQLDADLRKRLRTLWLEMIDRLRKL